MFLMNSLINLLLLGQMTERKEVKKDSREVTGFLECCQMSKY